MKSAKTKTGEAAEKQIQECFKLVSEACNKDAKMAKPFSVRGQCYWQMGDFQRALYDYSVAIRIAKDQGDPPKDLAGYYSKLYISYWKIS